MTMIESANGTRVVLTDDQMATLRAEADRRDLSLSTIADALAPAISAATDRAIEDWISGFHGRPAKATEPDGFFVSITIQSIWNCEPSGAAHWSGHLPAASPQEIFDTALKKGREAWYGQYGHLTFGSLAVLHFHKEVAEAPGGHTIDVGTVSMDNELSDDGQTTRDDGAREADWGHDQF